MIQPGPRNSIGDVDGIRVGNAEDHDALTGVTVILPDEPSVAAVDVRGGGPGTRETDALDPAALVGRIDAVVLSGGSAFGLDAAQGAMVWLAERGRGFPVGTVRVPIVPAAILFDLLNGGDKGWGDDPPYRRLGARACAVAAPDFAQGNAGAGMGAKAADLKGGLGSVSLVFPDGLQVGAVMAANPHGSAVMPGQSTFWAWMLECGDEFGHQRPPTAPVAADADIRPRTGDPSAASGANTTIGVVATNADLTPAEARRVAIMAQDGIARAIRPVHTPFDGDTVFVLATGRHRLPDPRAASVFTIGAVAADCVARAITRGVYLADTLGNRISYRERHRPGRVS